MILFLGAGASKPFGIPAMQEMTDRIRREFGEFEPFFREILDRLSRFQIVPDLEAILTVLTGFADPDRALQELGPFACYIYSLMREETTSPHKEEINDLVRKIKDFIVDTCIVQPEVFKKNVAIFEHLFETLNRIANSPIRVSSTKYTNTTKPLNLGFGGHYLPIDIFTTNYDLCVENYFAMKQTPYVYGFKDDVSSVKVRLHKLHGSINWYLTDKGIEEFVAKPALNKTFDGRDIKGQLLIYPTHQKNIYEYPFLAMFSSLTHNLRKMPLCISIGYSFRDSTINNIFADAIRANPSLKVIMLTPNANQIAEKLTFRNNVMPISGCIEDRMALVSLEKSALYSYFETL